MDSAIAVRLDNRKGNPHFDALFANKVQQTAKDYIESGLRNLNWAISDFDAASDIADMLQPIDSIVGPGGNFANVDRNSALCFRDPAGFTQMHVLSTFLAEILFGGEQARSVEAQKEEDSEKADDINALLAWNDRKQKIYLQGWLWIWNAVVYNRGVWYEDTDQDCEVVREPVEEDDITQKPVIQKDDRGKIIRDAEGKPIKSYPKRQRMRNKRVYSGFFNRLNIVSPYDFISDPSRTTLTFQEGRYAGHRVMIPWMELKRRSELEPTDQDYVLPHVVLKMKNTGTNAVVPSPVGGTVGLNNSRTYYERTLRGGGIARGGIGGSGIGAGAGVDGVNKDDGGTIECFVLFIRAKPSTLRMYDDDKEFEIIKILTTSTGDVLSVQCQPNKHDQFPYAFAESLPNSVRQYSPGWGLKCKPVQDRIDDLNVTHSTAMKRMGNILLIDSTKCDASNLLTPDKNGLMILRTEQGRGASAEDCVKQIPLLDTTANYNEEADRWEKKMENMTGANSYAQGETQDPSQTLGQFDATKRMTTGRVTSIARLLAEQGIMPQTMRWVSNFIQFASDEQMVRIGGKGVEYDPENPKKKNYKVIRGTDLAGSYDVVPADCSLPGADSKIVAAAARTIEAYAGNPALAPAFDVKIPGAIDPIAVFRDMLQKSGLPIEKYAVSREQAQKNTAQAIQAQQMQAGAPSGSPMDPNQGASPTPPPLPPAFDPGADALTPPAMPPATPPALNGVTS
jgi:hypothetical protein